MALDEAYLDVTVNKKNMAVATDIAREIRQKIWEVTQLTASAGVSYNKFLAKHGLRGAKAQRPHCDQAPPGGRLHRKSAH